MSNQRNYSADDVRRVLGAAFVYWFGNGRYVSTEHSGREVDEILDTRCMIDGIWIPMDGDPVGLAIRMQPIDPWRTWTVRVGEHSESGKLSRFGAYDYTGIRPAWIIQAYTTPNYASLLTAARIGVCDLAHRDPAYRNTNQTDGRQFDVYHWPVNASIYPPLPEIDDASF